MLSQPIANLPDSSEVASARKQLLDFLRSEATDEQPATAAAREGAGRLYLRRLPHRRHRRLRRLERRLVCRPRYTKQSRRRWSPPAIPSTDSICRTGRGAATRHTRIASRRVRWSSGDAASPGTASCASCCWSPRRRPPASIAKPSATRSRWSALGTAHRRSAILGPKFSGSVDSLARVLREDLEIRNRRRVRIISGTAATPNNRTVLEANAAAFKDSEGNVGKMVEFSATTHPFPEWLGALKRYLGSIDPAWAEGYGLAVPARKQYDLRFLVGNDLRFLVGSTGPLGPPGPPRAPFAPRAPSLTGSPSPSRCTSRGCGRPRPWPRRLPFIRARRGR